MSEALANTITGDVGKALEAIPLATATINAVQGDLSTAQHQTVAQTGLALTGTVINSLNTLAASGLIGHNDAANIAAGTTAAVDAVDFGTGLVADFEAAWNKLKAACPWL